jgi:hypothetical protein
VCGEGETITNEIHKEGEEVVAVELVCLGLRVSLPEIDEQRFEGSDHLEEVFVWVAPPVTRSYQRRALCRVRRRRGEGSCQQSQGRHTREQVRRAARPGLCNEGAEGWMCRGVGRWARQMGEAGRQAVASRAFARPSGGTRSKWG